MKKILFCLIIICCNACSDYKQIKTQSGEWYKTDKHAVFRYIEIDGHEYVEYRCRVLDDNNSSLCHSPKCHCLK